jgi:hypothetical protein
MGPIPGNKLPGYDHSVPPGQSLTRPLRTVLAELPDVFIHTKSRQKLLCFS